MNTVYIYANGEKKVYNDSMSVGVGWFIEMTVKGLKKWISIKSLPLIIPYERQYMKVMFMKDNEVFDHLLLFSSSKYLIENPEIKTLFEQIAIDYESRLFVVNIYEKNQNMLEFFGVDPSNLPTLSMVRIWWWFDV